MSIDAWVRAIDWPTERLPMNTTMLPMSLSKSGGMSMGGSEKVVQSGSGYWMGKIEFFLPDDRSVYVWQSIRSRLRGRAGTLRVPAYTLPTVPWTTGGLIAAGTPDVSPVPAPDLSLHTDDTDLSDGSEYEGSRWTVRLATAAAAQDEQIRVAILHGDYPLPGAFLSRYGQLHRIDTVSPTGVSGEFDLGIWPPLRANLSANSLLEADRPVCLMRLVSDEEGETSSGEYAVTISLREAL